MKSTPELKPPIFHPQFRQSIPAMVEEAHVIRNKLLFIMAEATSLVSSAGSYLEFEIDKLVVAIQKAEWENQVDLSKAKERLAELEVLLQSTKRDDLKRGYDTLDVIAGALKTFGQEHPP
jgi:hypothetical protein